MPDGTRVQKICHTVGRCRKTAFSFFHNSLEMSDIVEIRCNIEVHEQVQDPMSYNGDIEEEAYQTTTYDDAEEVPNSTVASYSDLGAEYHFSRFSGNHVEIHYNFVDESINENVCRLEPVLSYLIPEDRNVCRAAVTVVHNAR